MNNNDDVLRKTLVDTGYVALYKRWKFLKLMLASVNCESKNIYYDFTEFDLCLLGWIPDKKYVNICNRVVNNKSAKCSNIRKKIQLLLNHFPNCVFVTLTFDDECLKNTSPLTRRNYVKRFFNSQDLIYVANIDFGQDDKFTRREHYHAICHDYVDCSKWKYIINFEKIRYHDKSSKKLSKYINKLTNHATKIGACGSRLLATNCFEHKVFERSKPKQLNFLDLQK